MSGDSKFAGRGKRGKGGAVAEETADAPAVAPDDDGIEEQEYQPTEADGGMFGDVPAKKAKNFWPSAKTGVPSCPGDRLGLDPKVSFTLDDSYFKLLM